MDTYPSRTRRQVPVSEVMRPATTTVEPTASLASVAYLMHHALYGAVVVVDDAGAPVSLITDRDIVLASAGGADPGTTPASDWATEHPSAVDATATVEMALQVMIDSASDYIPVVSAGRLVGIVSMTDVVRVR